MSGIFSCVHSAFNKVYFTVSCANLVSADDWDNLVGLMRSTGLRLLYEFNLQLRYGQQWDPSRAMETLTYLDKQGYSDVVDFELGNGEKTLRC